MKPRILVVDDEKEFVQALAERLSIREYDVTTAYNGDEAIEKIKQYNYDVVILDVLMPGTSGIEVLRAIKNLKPLTEVIMLTGNATVETAIEGMKLGAIDYLMKPCDSKELMDKINQAHEKKAEHEERIQQARIKQIIASPRSVLNQ